MNGPAPGPLVVSKTNPRYFEAEGERRAVYLTGSHIWGNFHDGMGPGPECSGTSEVEPGTAGERNFSASIDGPAVLYLKQL